MQLQDTQTLRGPNASQGLMAWGSTCGGGPKTLQPSEGWPSNGPGLCTGGLPSPSCGIRSWGHMQAGDTATPHQWPVPPFIHLFT